MITAKHRKDFASQFPAKYRKPSLTANSRKKFDLHYVLFPAVMCDERN
jgi:hypothetical protein